VAMFEETGCDAVMVARGAQGNPFIFREILQLIETGSEAMPPTNEEKATALLKQAHLCIAEKGERLAMRQMRKQATWYLKGVHGAARARDAAVHIETFEDLVRLVREVYCDLDVGAILEKL